MIWDDPPHTCSTYTVASSTDTGGGTGLTYTVAQSGIKCLINTASASTVDMYAADQIQVSHTIGIKSSLLSTAVTRGMKVVADDGLSYHIEGIRTGRRFMAIPPFTYLDCRQLL